MPDKKYDVFFYDWNIDNKNNRHKRREAIHEVLFVATGYLSGIELITRIAQSFLTAPREPRKLSRKIVLTYTLFTHYQRITMAV